MIDVEQLTDTTPIAQGLAEIAAQRGEEMLAEVLKRHRAQGQYTTGETSRTLRVERTADGFRVVGWKYAGTYDEGRSNGKMPPVSAILAWIQAKGLTFDKPNSAEHYAYAIAKRIAERGTQRFRRPVDVWQTPIEDMRADLATLSTKYLALQVARTLKRTDLNNQ